MKKSIKTFENGDEYAIIMGKDRVYWEYYDPKGKLLFQGETLTGAEARRSAYQHNLKRKEGNI